MVVVDVVFIFEVEYVNERQYFIVLRQINQILNSSTLALTATFRNFVHSHPETPSLLSEEEHVLMVRRYINVLDEVFITGTGGFRAHSTSILFFVFSKWCTLDVTCMRNSNDHFRIWDHVFDTHITTCKFNRCSALITVLFFDFEKFVFDDFHSQGFIA